MALIEVIVIAFVSTAIAVPIREKRGSYGPPQSNYGPMMYRPQMNSYGGGGYGGYGRNGGYGRPDFGFQNSGDFSQSSGFQQGGGFQQSGSFQQRPSFQQGGGFQQEAGFQSIPQGGGSQQGFQQGAVQSDFQGQSPTGFQRESQGGFQQGAGSQQPNVPAGEPQENDPNYSTVGQQAPVAAGGQGLFGGGQPSTGFDESTFAADKVTSKTVTDSISESSAPGAAVRK